MDFFGIIDVVFNSSLLQLTRNEEGVFFYFSFFFLRFRREGDLHGEAKACANLSTCFKMIEKYSEAVLCAKRQLEICRRLNDKVDYFFS